VEAPREEVFQAIWDSEHWPSWWRGVESVRTLEEGDDEGVGSLGRYVWKSRLPYRLEFDTRITRVERPRLMEGEAMGELAGTGRWQLFEEHGVTAAVYDWNVRTTAPWMNLLAPIAQPVFKWNHDVVMRWGGEGIAKLLGARLLTHG
jgi:uncharacterized protein YndB with AHSA1/START domain